MEKKVEYVINGRRFIFIDIRKEAGVLRGYNKRRKKWAWLFDKYIQFDDETIVGAERIK